MNQQQQIMVRDCDWWNASEILRIEQACGSKFTCDYIAATMKLPGTITVIAYAGEQPIGWLQANELAQSTFLKIVSVHPEWRRKLVGARLVGNLFKRSQHMIFAEAAAKNIAARAFLRFMGFRAMTSFDDAVAKGKVWHFEWDGSKPWKKRTVTKATKNRIKKYFS